MSKKLQKNNNIIKKVERKLSSKGPKSLYFRFLLIILVPVLLIQLITTYIFYERHWESLSRNMIASLTGEISLIYNSVVELDEVEQKQFVQNIANNLMMEVSINHAAKLITYKNINDRYPELMLSLRENASTPGALFKEHNGRLRYSIQIGDDVLNIIFSNKRIINPSTYIFIIWVVGSAMLLSAIAVLFMRGQVRSILSLSKAAESFGKGHDLKDFKPAGAREIRLAGIAFIEMKERIRRLIDTRTQMLAGVSHDLKTPLTRMKLITSMIKDSDKKNSLEQEVDEMNKMIEGYLSFAQLEIRKQILEPIQSLNLKEFIQSITDRYINFPNTINTDIPDNIYLNIRPTYLRRAIGNLIDNALKYSKRLDIKAEFIEDSAIISFDDDGPGIPEDKLDQVFQPFYRLDESRNADTGGVGLGLSITRDIINKHGGDIKLSRSRLGGLRAVVILPK